MDDTPLEGLSSLIRLSGVQVPARARFVGEALISSTLGSLTVGLSFGMFGAAFFPCGPLIPFLIGSWTGYTFGLANHWRTCIQRMKLYAQDYPTILAHAMMTERGIVVPRNVIQASEVKLSSLRIQDVETDGASSRSETNIIARRTNDTTTAPTLLQWIHQGGLGRLTWSILAAQSCVSDIDELQRQHRQKLIEEHQEKYG